MIDPQKKYVAVVGNERVSVTLTEAEAEELLKLQLKESERSGDVKPVVEIKQNLLG